jgi:cystathionine beta-lyase/cystathionine gamma-synthase
MWHDHILLGCDLHPFEAWLLARGLKTFGVRMERHNLNAMAIAAYLNVHPAVENVSYPGHSTHPQHRLAKEQMTSGFGGMVSFTLKGGELAAFSFLEKLKLISLAVSLGGVHSLISHPQTTISSVQAEEVRSSLGIQGGLLRLSVGLEDVEDLLADMGNSLNSI